MTQSQAMQVLTSRATVQWYTPPWAIELVRAALRIFGKLLSEHEADAAAHALAAEATWRRARVVREAS